MPAVIENYALTTVVDVKESLGLAPSDTTKDNLIVRKINQVTDAIESYCQRRFALTQYTNEEYKASHIDEMTLKQRPILIDDSHPFLFEWRTTAFNANNWETIDSQLYFVDQNAGVLNLMFFQPGYWNRYRVSYWAGFATIPNDLAEAANVLACWFVNHPSGNTAYLAGQTEGSRSTRYVLHANKSFNLLMSELGVDEIIDSYSNMPILTDR